MKKKVIIFSIFSIFVLLSFINKYSPGQEIGVNFFNYFSHMIKVLPIIFILIGLFEVWIKRETIEKHLGSEGGIKSFIWVFILAAPMAGGLLPALPIANSLYKKGARGTIIFAFLGAVSIGRIPMILFESTFLGWQFSFLRLMFSIPLIIISSIFLGKISERIYLKS
jgi:uncharacterized membrane protein YraQ (UPF0718 family)